MRFPTWIMKIIIKFISYNYYECILKVIIHNMYLYQRQIQYTHPKYNILIPLNTIYSVRWDDQPSYFSRDYPCFTSKIPEYQITKRAGYLTSLTQHVYTYVFFHMFGNMIQI